MRLGSLCTLTGVCLFLLASGCASPARRAGLAAGAGNAPIRLLRPADPIARLGPAPVSVGPMSDPGSYTPASVPDAVGPGPGVGPLTVGGGQLALADRRPVATGTSRARAESRAGTGGGTGAGTPRALVAEAARPSVAAPDGRGSTSDPAEDRLARARPDAEAAVGPRPADAPEEASGDPASPDARTGSTPLLAEGIDLETYATPPPLSNDPEAQLASGRRPIALLRDARAAIRSGAAAGERPAPEAESAPAEPARGEGRGAAPSERPQADPSRVIPDLGPLPGADDRPPARDDVRPTSAVPGHALADSTPSGRPGMASPSPIGEGGRGDRLGGRVRRLAGRLMPGRAAHPSDPSPGIEGGGRLLRIPRLWGADDARWLMPGG